MIGYVLLAEFLFDLFDLFLISGASNVGQPVLRVALEQVKCKIEHFKNN